MSSDVPEELVQSIEAFEEELAELKAELGPLLQSDNETLLETLSPLDRARLQVMTAYAVVSLYHGKHTSCVWRVCLNRRVLL